MQALKLATVVIAVLLAIVSAAQADTTDNINQQFSSKRPHSAPQANSKATASDPTWEGATKRATESEQEEAPVTKSAQHLKQLKINRLAQRNYM